VVLACGSGSSSAGTHWPKVLEVKSPGAVTPLLVQDQIQVGDNRFAVGLLDKDEQPIVRAGVRLSLYQIDGETGALKGDFEARYVGFDTNFVEQRADGSRVTHTGPEVGVYETPFVFDTAGDWGVRVTATVNGKQYKDMPIRFNVLAKSNIPAIGALARPSRQLTVADVPDIGQIDTSNPPHPELHNLTVADALATGKPIVLAFATPAYCTSRTCGPVIDKVVVPLSQKYGDRAIFIHIEPYDVQSARSGRGLVPIQSFLEWGLQSEPWVFVIDKTGRVVAKFEGIMGIEEVSAVLDRS